MTQLEMATAVLDNPFVGAWDALAPVPALWFMGFRFMDDDCPECDDDDDEGWVSVTGEQYDPNAPIDFNSLVFGFPDGV